MLQDIDITIPLDNCQGTVVRPPADPQIIKLWLVTVAGSAEICHELERRALAKVAAGVDALKACCRQELPAALVCVAL